jgi:hypothetical protein
MPKINHQPFRIAPLQRVIAEPMTPAERAAMDKVRQKRKQAARKKPKHATATKKRS